VPDPTPEVDPAAVRRELEARRDEVRARVARLAQRPERGAAQGFGKRIGDGTVEAISRLTDIGVGRSLEQTLARMERALAKLDDGTYGRCDSCGQPIAAARLHAMPDVTLCMTCAAAEPRIPPPRR
jgi:DnaK suppressor protein